MTRLSLGSPDPVSHCPAETHLAAWPVRLPTSRVTHCQESILPDRENRVRVLAGIHRLPPINSPSASRAIARGEIGASDCAPLSRYLPSSSYPYLGFLYPPTRPYCDRSIHTMAIHPQLRSRESQGTLSPQQAVAISAWTEQASASLENLTLSESRPEANASTPSHSGLRGATVSISIPLDDEPPATPSRVKIAAETRPPTVSFRRREPLRRDSLKRREALLKGKDGSRRRQRWENGMAHRVLGTPSRG